MQCTPQRIDDTPLPMTCGRNLPGISNKFVLFDLVPQTLLTKLLQNSVSLKELPSCSATEEATLLESEEYRQYAKDCTRIAETMNAKDKQTLLKIAEAWEARALEAESKEKKSGDR
jgi:hypothetical protein